MTPRNSVPPAFGGGLTRRNVLKLGAALSGTALLAACSGPAVGGTDSTASAAAQDWSGVKPASEITWWSNHPGASITMEQQFVTQFQQANPGIKVNLVTAGASYDEIAQRFQAAAGTDSLPDVVGASDVWWFRYMINSQVLPLEGLAKHLEIDTGDFNKTLYDDYKFNDQHWAFPYARSMPMFYYNKTMWAAAGLPDRAPKDWAEFESWAPALAGQVNGAPPLGLAKGASWAAWWFCNIMWGMGGEYSHDWTLDLDKPETLAAGEYLRSIINDKKIAVISAADEIADFTAGITACTIGSTGSITSLINSAKFELGAGALPQGPKGGPVAPTGGTGMAIASAKSPEQQLAAGMFLKFLTDTDQTATFAKGTGYLPVRTSAAKGSIMSALYKEHPQYQTAADQLSGARSQDWARAFVPSGDQYLTTALESIMLQNAKPADVFPKAAADITTSYKQNVEPYL